jgi:uncharacterized repeat protein (TIGR03803 family)
VRTELFHLLVIPSLAPHPVQTNRQAPRHRDFGDLPPPAHHQKDGNLYGITDSGGQDNGGTAFELSQSGGVWTETILHAFGSSGDGQFPLAALAMDSAGNLYGTTSGGGLNGNGTVFEITRSGGVWTETVIYEFQYDYNGQRDGASPSAGVTFDKAGKLYGTTTGGGAGTGCSSGCGTVYRLTHSKSGWKESVLHSFQGGKGGSYPVAGVTLIDGKFWGTTSFGGSGSCNLNLLTGCGTIFSLEQSSNKWVVPPFSLKGKNGSLPQPGVVADKKGALFGTTLYGGTGSCTDNLPGCGVVYKLVRRITQKLYFSPNCMVLDRCASTGCRNEPPARQLASPAELFGPP